MLPSKWNNVFSKPCESIIWDNSAFTFQSNCCFPLPRHNYLPYFEVFITGISPEGTVAIGVGSADISGKDLLPGWRTGSYGYHSKGKVFLGEEEGAPYGPIFATGDVVGCGITLDGKLYFTKNGQNLGTACTIQKAKVFPIIGLDKASISTNFGHSQFFYYPFTNSATPRQDALLSTKSSTINEPTVMQILSFCSPESVVQFSMTNKRNFQIAKSNQFWEPLVFQRWETVSKDIPIPSFYEFFKRRTIKQAKAPLDPLIENCVQWEFQCPATLDKFQRTSENYVDFCTVCTKNVYLVHNMEDLQKRVAEQQCVAIDFDRFVTGSRPILQSYPHRGQVKRCTLS
eukprot:Phypoly_transcript_03263.p1 GENE.Phypoly_transcript_03263~~Phypoly_transcript_03263.p1  ORF type:complete len:343 (+),score=40.18 Phypoly_transcript_03263:1242-2270(+)